MTEKSEVYKAVLDDCRAVEMVLRFMGKGIEALQHNAETIIGILRNGATNQNPILREQCRLSFNELLRQADQTINDLRLFDKSLLDGGVDAGFDPAFDIRIDFQGLGRSSLDIEAVNLNMLAGSERAGSGPGRVVDFELRSDIGAYSPNLTGDALLISDLGKLSAFITAIRAVARHFGEKLTQVQNAHEEVERDYIAYQLSISGKEIVGTNDGDVLVAGLYGDTIFGNDGDDYVNGGVDDDVLSGGDGNDHLLGEAGNDTLHGGAGSDTISGGDGDDLIFYDADDVAANITGGKGTDMLYVIGAAVPTAFNLATQGFERASCLQFDSTNQAWSNISDIYDSNWARLQSIIVMDDKTQQDRNFDHANNQAYVEYVDYYLDITFAGTITRQMIIEDAGTKQERFFDYRSNQTYSEYINVYADTAFPNAVTRQVIFDDGGTNQERIFDYTSTQPTFSEYINFYTDIAQPNKVTRQVGFADGGGVAWEYFF